MRIVLFLALGVSSALEDPVFADAVRDRGDRVVYGMDLYVVDPCDPPATPRPAQDVNLFVEGGFHSLSPGSISSGLLFLIDALGPEP